MTPQETIKTIKIAIAEVEWNYPMEYAVAFENAITSLEKQIPKKTVKGNIITGNDYCPICHYFVQPPCEKYCLHCGQALEVGDCG